MIWLNPAAFGLLAFIPVVLLLHALRYRRRDVRISTLFLWESVLREAQGSLGLRRLVQNLPLLLQILLVCLLSLALAKPVLTKEVAQSKDMVLILDSSASMQTRTAQGTRFTQAQQRALAFVRDLPDGRQMAIIAAARQPQVLTFFTSEKALLRQVINEAQSSDAPGNMREALLLALSFTHGSGAHEVVIIGDGAYGDLSDLALPKNQIRHIPITDGDTNVGITRLAIRKRLQADDQYEMLIAVKNFSAQAVTVPLQTTLPRRRVLTHELLLQPGQEEVLVSVLEGPLQGVIKAELLFDDDFPLDNRAYGVVSPATQTWILLVGEANYFLETLLTSLPGVLVNVVPQVTAEALPRLLEANRLIIFNGVQPPPLRSGNFLLINTVPQDPRLTPQGMVTSPHIVDWQRQHPLLEFVDLAEVHIEEALVLHPQAGVQSLFDATETSLLSVIDEPPLRLVVLGFDLMRSDLPLRVAFPVFISNLLRWITPSETGDRGGQIQAGAPYAVFFDTPLEQITVQNPQGKKRDYTVSGNPWLFTDTQRIGVYILRGDNFKRYVAVNLLDEAESDIAPANILPPLSPTETDVLSQSAGLVATPVWLAVLLGAVLVLCSEWYAWCRDL